MILPKLQAIKLCQKNLEEALSFKGELAMGEAIVRIVKNQYAIMQSLNVLLEDIIDRENMVK